MGPVFTFALHSLACYSVMGLPALLCTTLTQTQTHTHTHTLCVYLTPGLESVFIDLVATCTDDNARATVRTLSSTFGIKLKL